MSPDPEGKCQGAFGGQKAVGAGAAGAGAGADGARMEYQPDHPADQAHCALCVVCYALCAAILLGIEFQIEIQQTRNYCQASPQEISRQHIMYRLFNFSCPRAAVRCEFENGIILDNDILFFFFFTKSGQFYF